MNNNNLNHHDPEIDTMIEQLNAMSDSDRSAPDAGFEQRMMDAISETIAPDPLSIEQARVHSNHFVVGWKLNIAAAFVLVASVSLLLWTSNGVANKPAPATQSAQQTLVSLEANIDALFELTDFADALDSDMDELDLMTDAMQTELSMPSVLMEVADQTLTEGSL